MDFKSFLGNILFFFIGFLPLAHAGLDPYYLNNPSCVIDRGNPARTGEYLTTPLKDHPKLAWIGDIYGQGFSPLLCLNDLIFTSGPSAININNGETLWYIFGTDYYAVFLIYKNSTLFRLKINYRGI